MPCLVRSQRTVTYFIHSRGARVVLSSVRHLREDLPAVAPDHLVCVPLVLDTLHAKVW